MTCYVVLRTMAASPAPDCASLVGLLPVFEDREEAEEWAGDSQILTLEVASLACRKKQRNPTHKPR